MVQMLIAAIIVYGQVWPRPCGFTAREASYIEEASPILFVNMTSWNTSKSFLAKRVARREIEA